MEKKYYIGSNNDRAYELYHHGILGQKWGVRRFQNEDGSLTSAGEKRYTENNSSTSKRELKRSKRELKRYNKGEKLQAKGKTVGKTWKKAIIGVAATDVIGVTGYNLQQKLGDHFLSSGNYGAAAVAKMSSYATLGAGALVQAGFVAKAVSDTKSLNAYNNRKK